MPKINVYLPDELAEAVRDARVPVSAICQSALERVVRDVTAARGSEKAPADEGPALGLFSRCTPRARQVFVLADQQARAIPNNFVGTEHLLLGVLDEGGNLALGVLRALEVEPADVRAELIASVEPGHAPGDGGVPFTPLAKDALEAAVKEALTLGHNYLGCEHLLLGLLAVEDGLASNVLRRMGVELRTTRRAVVTALTGLVHQMKQTAEPAAPAPMEDTLQEILRRLEAIEGRLDR
jgi:ATP-dependent Clp protease ATP-binding subunit ClpC